MEAVNYSFSESLKKGLVNDENATFIYINNFEVEQYWKTSDIVGIPSVSTASAKIMVNRMEEQGVLFSSPTDIVILKRPVSNDF